MKAGDDCIMTVGLQESRRLRVSNIYASKGNAERKFVIYNSALIFIKSVSQLYKTRGKHLKHAAEEEMWAQLSWEYMTEESEADDDIITTHCISFRSDGKN